MGNRSKKKRWNGPNNKPRFQGKVPLIKPKTEPEYAACENGHVIDVTMAKVMLFSRDTKVIAACPLCMFEFVEKYCELRPVKAKKAAKIEEEQKEKEQVRDDDT